MHAQPGDWLLVNGNRVGDLDRTAMVLEVRGEDGRPPYLVRWLEDDRVSLFFPGPGAAIRHASAAAPPGVSR